MSNKLTVTFDGSVLKPDTPLELELIKRYVITLIAEETKSGTRAIANAWDLLEKLTGIVEAPQDWASEHDHYLYGTPIEFETPIKVRSRP